jgi:hypothetical protein
LSITSTGRAQLRRAADEFRGVLDEVLAECADPDEVLDALAVLGDALDERWLQRVAKEELVAHDGGRR